MFLDVRATRTLKSLVRRVLGRSAEDRIPSIRADVHSEEAPHLSASPCVSERAQAEAWLAAFEAGHLHPPRDVHDPAAWDAYWKNHLSVGPMEQGCADMMSSDPELPRLLARRDTQQPITIELSFASFDDYWSPFLGGQGPAGAYAASLSAALVVRSSQSFAHD